MMKLTRKVKCIAHNLVLLLPETDSEHVELVTQVTKLLQHLNENPSCKFQEIQL